MNKGGHWPFTAERNRDGRIQPEPLIEAVKAGGKGDNELCLELAWREREPSDRAVVRETARIGGLLGAARRRRPQPAPPERIAPHAFRQALGRHELEDEQAAGRGPRLRRDAFARHWRPAAARPELFVIPPFTGGRRGRRDPGRHAGRRWACRTFTGAESGAWTGEISAAIGGGRRRDARRDWP